jgi:hypothetical protein
MNRMHIVNNNYPLMNGFSLVRHVKLHLIISAYLIFMSPIVENGLLLPLLSLTCLLIVSLPDRQ